MLKSYKEFLTERSDPFSNLDKSTALAKLANSGKDNVIDGQKVTVSQSKGMLDLYSALSDRMKAEFDKMKMKDLFAWVQKAKR